MTPEKTAERTLEKTAERTPPEKTMKRTPLEKTAEAEGTPREKMGGDEEYERNRNRKYIYTNVINNSIVERK